MKKGKQQLITVLICAILVFIASTVKGQNCTTWVNEPVTSQFQGVPIYYTGLSANDFYPTSEMTITLYGKSLPNYNGYVLMKFGDFDYYAYLPNSNNTNFVLNIRVKTENGTQYINSDGCWFTPLRKTRKERRIITVCSQSFCCFSRDKETAQSAYFDLFVYSELKINRIKITMCY